MKLSELVNYNQNHMRLVLPVKDHEIQSKPFERSTKRAPQLPPLSSTFLNFSNIASNEWLQMALTKEAEC